MLFRVSAFLLFLLSFPFTAFSGSLFGVAARSPEIKVNEPVKVNHTLPLDDPDWETSYHSNHFDEHTYGQIEIIQKSNKTLALILGATNHEDSFRFDDDNIDYVFVDKKPMDIDGGLFLQMDFNNSDSISQLAASNGECSLVGKFDAIIVDLNTNGDIEWDSEILGFYRTLLKKDGSLYFDMSPSITIVCKDNEQADIEITKYLSSEFILSKFFECNDEPYKEALVIDHNTKLLESAGFKVNFYQLGLETYPLPGMEVGKISFIKATNPIKSCSPKKDNGAESVKVVSRVNESSEQGEDSSSESPSRESDTGSPWDMVEFVDKKEDQQPE